VPGAALGELPGSIGNSGAVGRVTGVSRFFGGLEVEFAGPAVTVEPGPSGSPGKLSEALGLACDAPEEPAVDLHICHPRVDVELEPRK